MQITWVNHASFVIESGPIRLLSDPWIEGTAFNESWELLVPSVFGYDDFTNITHIWFSHEHPDHFAPLVLRKIAPEVRAKIVVLFQKTLDQRVASFCRRLDFKSVIELDNDKPLELAEHFTVTCHKVPFYDSWLHCKVDGYSILNANDCILDRFDIRRAHQRFKTFDVLFTQFSYASWYGNPDEPQRWKQAAVERLSALLDQVKLLHPKFVVPCASHVRFCHVDNQHMNHYSNQIEDVVAEINAQGISTPVVLFPGDKWTLGEPHDNASAIKRYQDARLNKTYRTSPTVPADELCRLASEYHKRMLKNNCATCLKVGTALGALPPVVFEVSDLNMMLRFDWRNGLKLTSEPADITLHSDALAYLFRFDWGLDTLYVSSRFTVAKGCLSKLIRTFSPGSLNNIGRRLSPELMFNTFLIKRAVRKLINPA